MEASYTWHPGAHCLKPRWPLTPPILPDELFSSWLIRTAHAHVCSPSTLTASAWPKSHAWAVDLDRWHSWADFKALSGIVGMSPQTLLACTLWRVMSNLHPIQWCSIREMSHGSSLWGVGTTLTPGADVLPVLHRWTNTSLSTAVQTCMAHSLPPASSASNRPLPQMRGGLTARSLATRSPAF
ncbi:hypothetical protein EGN69_01465 [Pseudomonas monteilii]|nr:hypothetical protein EGN69_01465 [Pseudomonas monteilii]